MNESIMSFRDAWKFIRKTAFKDHDPQCSYYQTRGADLCNCKVLEHEYERRRREMERR